MADEANQFTDEDMAQVGRDLMEEIEAHSGQWPLKGWGPMDTPAEVVSDLVNMLVEMKEQLDEARDRLSGLSSYLGAGIGDDNTTIKQFDDRIRWGIDYIGSVYRNRAAAVVEECSKNPRTTWGSVRRAILDDTALPTAVIAGQAGGGNNG